MGNIIENNTHIYLSIKYASYLKFPIEDVEILIGGDAYVRASNASIFYYNRLNTYKNINGQEITITNEPSDTCRYADDCIRCIEIGTRNIKSWYVCMKILAGNAYIMIPNKNFIIGDKSTADYCISESVYLLHGSDNYINESGKTVPITDNKKCVISGKVKIPTNAVKASGTYFKYYITFANLKIWQEGDDEKYVNLYNGERIAVRKEDLDYRNRIRYHAKGKNIRINEKSLYRCDYYSTNDNSIIFSYHDNVAYWNTNRSGHYVTYFPKHKAYFDDDPDGVNNRGNGRYELKDFKNVYTNKISTSVNRDSDIILKPVITLYALNSES